MNRLLYSNIFPLKSPEILLQDYQKKKKNPP